MSDPDKKHQEGPSQLARIGAVIALIGSLIWVQWPVDFTKFNVASVIIFVAALVAWLSIELGEYRVGNKFNDNVVSDDVGKLNSILKIVNSNQYYILRNKAIQTYMGDDDYEGIRKLINYKENDLFPFHNEKIQKLFDRFSKDSRKFYMDFYQIYTSDGRGMSTWRAPGEGYVSEEIYKRVMGEIAALDRTASKLADLWEEFVKVAREELKGASKPIDRYEI